MRIRVTEAKRSTNTAGSIGVIHNPVPSIEQGSAVEIPAGRDIEGRSGLHQHERAEAQPPSSTHRSSDSRPMPHVDRRRPILAPVIVRVRYAGTYPIGVAVGSTQYVETEERQPRVYLGIHIRHNLFQIVDTRGLDEHHPPRSPPR